MRLVLLELQLFY